MVLVLNGNEVTNRENHAAGNGVVLTNHALADLAQTKGLGWCNVSSGLLPIFPLID